MKEFSKLTVDFLSTVSDTTRRKVSCGVALAFTLTAVCANAALALELKTVQTYNALPSRLIIDKSQKSKAIAPAVTTRDIIPTPVLDSVRAAAPDGAQKAASDTAPDAVPMALPIKVGESNTTPSENSEASSNATTASSTAIKDPEQVAASKLDKVEMARHIDNFDVVNPHIWRGGAPSKAGLAKLAASGVKTIVDLRMTGVGTLAEEVQAKSLGLNYVHIPMNFTCPPVSTVAQFMHVATNPLNQPVYVHCRQGADRTGTLIGIMRVTQDKWSYRQAYSEMRQHHFKPWFGNLSRMVENYENNRTSQRQLAQATQAFQ